MTPDPPNGESGVVGWAVLFERSFGRKRVSFAVNTEEMNSSVPTW